MKKLIVVTLCLLFAFGAYLSVSTVDNSVPVATAGSSVYSATIYVAGMGGHFAAADIEIDPSSAMPITVKSLGRIVIGNKDTHPVHDPRIDVNDRTKMYWSTYKPDKTADGRVHVGLSDLTTGKVLVDRSAPLDARAKWKGALYCASGQTKKSYLPMTMTDEAYIDVFEKGSMGHKHRVFLDYKPGETLFYHGINSPDMKTFIIAINRKSDGKPNGKIDLKILDLKKLEKGKLKVKLEKTITGTPGKTKTFRSSFTPDGKLLLQSAADRFYLIDAKTLKVLDQEMMDNVGQNHDAISTPDGKYAVLTVRKSVDGVKDGQLALYDINARKVIGGTTSVCIACHKDLGIVGNATLCGADANWN